MARAKLFAALALMLGAAAARASAEGAPAAGKTEVKLIELPGFEAPVPVRVAAQVPAAAGPAEENPCADVADRVDFLEAPVLDLKARYWAARMKEGATIAELKEWPGVHLNDPALRRSFVQKLKAYSAQEGFIGPSAEKTALFLKADQAARRLERACGKGEFRPPVRQAIAATVQEKGGS